MLSVAGKRAVITGGSRGIGLAIAKRFADEGAACILVGRHENSLVTAVRTLPKVTLPHSFIQGDVQRTDTWESLVAQHNKIDILVNAAGRSQETLLFKTGYDDISDILASNLGGTAFGCRAVGRLMIKQKTGCIINVSSLMATKGAKGASVYAASKAGLLAPKKHGI
ncbi:putative 3-oxoacyl-(acyl-carrier-protein) reductase protein [Phaeoacremonium minimum UCRPA7]|uniref:Putative 3-oxoacyl-(Acyl-carrier-protein) reductase protein n=1 Tax=Phaeoacremonium minimum (strain UCR-PA7) TaxID=1286976 RepID=R8BM53_PHAM7|nr:putative 3-oxoacyl-(acyl-carrier-protein) reductase protein [Phaeoacremonium minimum UCRPA7]EOO00456.1 putative 3-oxoacyl-(acyl-carrier-protein) reductase protein [Phaeoacremonium minimum UCRPA7]